MITTKRHNLIIKDMRERWEQRIEELKEELRQAKDLKLILEKLYPLWNIEGSAMSFKNGGWSINLSDDVLQYTEDILGGKVIKQEGVKCLIISKDGSVKTGLTKSKTDKGYSYKLIRE